MQVSRHAFTGLSLRQKQDCRSRFEVQATKTLARELARQVRSIAQAMRHSECGRYQAKPLSKWQRPMDLTGHYSNPSGPLKVLLEAAVAGSGGRRRPLTLSRSLPPGRRLGAVKRAIRSVLSDANGPVAARDVHASVEERLERSVSYDNIRKVLSAAARDPSSGIARSNEDGTRGLASRQPP